LGEKFFGGGLCNGQAANPRFCRRTRGAVTTKDIPIVGRPAELLNVGRERAYRSAADESDELPPLSRETVGSGDVLLGYQRK
jgi:hypothetical protein